MFRTVRGSVLLSLVALAVLGRLAGAAVFSTFSSTAATAANAFDVSAEHGDVWRVSTGITAGARSRGWLLAAIRRLSS
jgi:hypothetical protein